MPAPANPQNESDQPGQLYILPYFSANVQSYSSEKARSAYPFSSSAPEPYFRQNRSFPPQQHNSISSTGFVFDTATSVTSDRSLWAFSAGKANPLFNIVNIFRNFFHSVIHTQTPFIASAVFLYGIRLSLAGSFVLTTSL